MAELQLEEAQALVRHFLAGAGTAKDLALLHQAMGEDSAVALELVAQVQEAFENKPPAKLTPLQLAQVQARVDALIAPHIRYNGLKGRLKKLLGRTKASTRNGYVEPQAPEAAPAVPPAAAAPVAEPEASGVEVQAPVLAADRPASDPPVLPEEAPPSPEAELPEPEPEGGASEPRTLDIEDEPAAKPRSKALVWAAAGAVLALAGLWSLSRRQAPPPPAQAQAPVVQAPAVQPSPVPTSRPTVLPQRGDVSQLLDGSELPVELPPLTPRPAGHYSVPAP